MRIYLQANKLAKQLKQTLATRSISQISLANSVNSTQGEISHLLAGRFKTENGLVRRVCKYVNIPLKEYRLKPMKKPPSDILMALTQACHGDSRRIRAVARILRAVEAFG